MAAVEPRVVGANLSRIVADSTQCSICHEPFVDPKLLRPCFHTFCRRCLENWAAGNGRPGDRLSCPMCRSEFVVPDGGLASLDKNFYVDTLLEIDGLTRAIRTSSGSGTSCEICVDDDEEDDGDGVARATATTYCVECRQRLCDRCARGHRRQRATREHHLRTSPGAELSDGAGPPCARHRTMPVTFYCNDCGGAPCCATCRGDEHDGHDCIDVHRAAASLRGRLRGDVERMATDVEALEEELRKSVRMRSEVVGKMEELRRRVDGKLDRVIDVADRERRKLSDRIAEEAESRLRELDAAKDELQRRLETMRGFVQRCVVVARASSSCEVVQLFDELRNAEDELKKARIVERCSDDRFVPMAVENDDLESECLRNIASALILEYCGRDDVISTVDELIRRKKLHAQVQASEADVRTVLDLKLENDLVTAHLDDVDKEIKLTHEEEEINASNQEQEQECPLNQECVDVMGDREEAPLLELELSSDLGSRTGKEEDGECATPEAEVSSLRRNIVVKNVQLDADKSEIDSFEECLMKMQDRIKQVETELNRTKNLMAVSPFGCRSDRQQLTTGVPGVPDTPAVTDVTSSTCTVSYGAPSVTGGSAIIGYHVEMKTMGVLLRARWYRLNRDRILGQNFHVTGLDEGYSYAFRVAAENRSGIGPFSPESQPVTARNPWNRPGRPGQPTAVQHSADSVVLEWSAPDDDGGDGISGYAVECREQKSRTWRPCDAEAIAGGGTARGETVLVGGLRESTRYRFRVAARNRAGRGPFSAGSAYVVTRPARPGIPSAPEVVDVGSTSCTLTYSPPDYCGGSPITGYHLEMKTIGAASADDAWVRLNKQRVDDLSFCVAVLRGGGRYAFRVAAENGSGVGEFGPESESVVAADPLTSPGKPGSPRAVDVSSHSLVLEWAGPENDGGAEISDYLVEFAADDGESTPTWTGYSGGGGGGGGEGDGKSPVSGRTVVTGLTELTRYKFRVAAVNCVGVGEYTDPTDWIRTAMVMIDPEILEPPQDQTVSLLWSATFSTTVRLGRPCATIKWLRGHTQLMHSDAGKYRIKYDNGMASLHIRKCSFDDVGEYRVEVANAKSTVSSGAKLFVEEDTRIGKYFRELTVERTSERLQNDPLFLSRDQFGRSKLLLI